MTETGPKLDPQDLQHIAALLDHIEGPAPFRILDFGCGPGRDLKVFTDLGHTAIGLEGAMAPTMRRIPGSVGWRRSASSN